MHRERDFDCRILTKVDHCDCENERGWEKSDQLVLMKTWSRIATVVRVARADICLQNENAIFQSPKVLFGALNLRYSHQRFYSTLYCRCSYHTIERYSSFRWLKKRIHWDWVCFTEISYLFDQFYGNTVLHLVHFVGHHIVSNNCLLKLRHCRMFRLRVHCKRNISEMLLMELKEEQFRKKQMRENGSFRILRARKIQNARCILIETSEWQ